MVAFDHLNMGPSVGHLNGILARVGGNLNKNFKKSQIPGGLPGGSMLKLRFDRYITVQFFKLTINIKKSRKVA